MTEFAQLHPVMIVALVAAMIVTLALLAVIIRRAIRSGAGPRLGFGVAVVIAVAVAVIGGVTSFQAVAHRFSSSLIPLVADGMVIACTALRLAAMTHGWRIPGALVTTYVFIIGSVVINMASVHGWAAKLGHALAPLAYAVLVEMLAYLLRQKMRLARPARPRLSALTWCTSPVITTRVWLHLARTGTDDPVAARALIQQMVRTGSRLAAVCPSRPAWLPVGHAHAARSAAMHATRDGLLSAADVAQLLPTDGIAAAELLALIDRAALGLPTGDDGAAGGTVAPAGVHRPVRPSGAESVHRPDPVSAPAPVRTAAVGSAPSGAASAVHLEADANSREVVPPDGDDAELVAWLRRHAVEHNDGDPLSARAVMRLLSSGWSKAKRIHQLAGWNDPTDGTDASETDEDQQPKAEPRQLHLMPNATQIEPIQTETDHQESRA